MSNNDDYVMAPTPPEIAAHLDKWTALLAAKADGLPTAPVEWQPVESGDWRSSGYVAAWWRFQANPDVPRHAYRLCPLPALPPEPETVVVVDANTAHALIGRRKNGVEICEVMTYWYGWHLRNAQGEVIANGPWRRDGEPSTVSLDPLPTPPPEEAVETVTVVLAALHEAMQTYRGFRGDDTLAADAAHLARWMDENYDRLRAALDAEAVTPPTSSDVA